MYVHLITQYVRNVTDVDWLSTLLTQLVYAGALDEMFSMPIGELDLPEAFEQRHAPESTGEQPAPQAAKKQHKFVLNSSDDVRAFHYFHYFHFFHTSSYILVLSY